MRHFAPLSSCFLLFTATSAFAGPSLLRGKLRDNVTLQCQAPTRVTISVLEWTRTDLKSDDYVFLYRNARSYDKYQHPAFRGRVVLKDPEMRDGDVSVVLTNIGASDTGTYVCCVTWSSTERFNSSVSLGVHVPGSPEEAEDGGRTEKLHEHDPPVDVRLLLGSSAAATVLLVLVVVFISIKYKVSCPKCPHTSTSSYAAGEPEPV